MIREIVEIDEAKCDGCGQCIPSCAEGALYLEGGKVKLRADALCDGLGACLGECPKDALRVVRRDAAAFDEAAVHAALAHAEPAPPPARATPRLAPVHEAPGGCPGSRPRTLSPVPTPGATPPGAGRGPRPLLSVVADAPPPVVPQGGSRLGQWPVQLHLVSPGAPYLRGADLLVAADCVPFAYARFHEELLDGRRVLVGCPKLDDLAGYAEKLAEIFRRAEPRSVTVAKMEVPCCGGIAQAARQALAVSGSKATFEVVTVGIAGAIVDRRG
jgi:Pyruvate/2-oxoacid:ferredoxin oxidoreductase delta subunit